MSVGSTTGVTVLARMLRRMAEGEAGTVTAFAEAEGFARSTVFDISRRLEAAGFVERDVDGALQAGPAAISLALAEWGIAALHGPAEALLAQLRDEAQANVRLVAGDGTTILEFATKRASAIGTELSAAVTEHVRLALSVRANAARAERDEAALRLAHYAASLRHYLATDGKEDG
jgi:hypothetical protein